MHGITRAVERRLAALEKRLGAVPTIETPDQTARRAELVRAALEGREPVDLQGDERAVFARIVACVPTFRELQQDGIIDAHGRPSGVGDDYPHHEDGDGDGQEPVWVP